MIVLILAALLGVLSTLALAFFAYFSLILYSFIEDKFGKEATSFFVTAGALWLGFTLIWGAILWPL